MGKIFYLLGFMVLMLMPHLLYSQDCKNPEEFWIWPEKAGYCRVYGKENPGREPVLFLSDVGMEYTYLEKNSKLNDSVFNTTFFDQPGVTHSVCVDTSFMRLESVTNLIHQIQDIVGTEAPIHIVCHGQGCHFALAYAQKHPGLLKTIHMVQPPLINQNGKTYLTREKKPKSYMRDLNDAYGAMFFPIAFEEYVRSFPEKQSIATNDVFLYWSSQKANGMEEGSFKEVYQIESGNQSLSFLKNAEFWTALEKNILAK